MITLPVWPNTVRMSGSSGVSGGPQTNVASFQPEVGPSIDRRRASSFVKTYGVTLPLITAAEHAAFRNFFHNTLSDGVLPFVMRDPMTGQWYKCKFAQGSDRAYTETRITADLFNVQFNMSVIGVSIINSAYDALAGEIGTWFDFVNDRAAIIRENGTASFGRLLDLLTFSRASTATYVGADGLLKTAAAGELRYDHDPVTGAPLGVLLEGARTNRIRNNSMQDAAAGTPGTAPSLWVTLASTLDGLSREIIGIGTDKGIDYIDVKFSGTSGMTGDNVLASFDQFAGSNGQSWTESCYLAIAGGSIANIANLNLDWEERDNTTQLARHTGPNIIASLTGVMTRFEHASTAAQVATTVVRPRLVVNFTNSSAVDFTLRIGLPQMEQGAFASSVIRTTTASATRNADSLSALLTLFPFNPAEGTLYTEASINRVNSQIGTGIVAISDGTNNNRIESRIIESNASQFIAVVGNSFVVFLASGTDIPAGTVRRMAGSWRLDDYAASHNGAAIQIDTTGGVPPTNQLKLGSPGSGVTNLFGHVRRVALIPRRLTNAQLQALSLNGILS